jgi:hypothetical protein
MARLTCGCCDRSAVRASATALQAEETGALPPQDVTDTRRTSRSRQALRRLQSATPSAFEEVIDLIYLWKEHAPEMQLTDFMRKLIGSNHNLSDQNAISAMKGFIKEARMEKVNAAITKMGLDAAEEILGLKKGP